MEGHVLQALLRGYCSWWWVMGILGLAIHYLNFTTPAVEYLTRAAYPVYIIHMPILSVIALWVVRLDMSILAKYGLIVVASLAASLAVYEFIIQRVGVLRLLFGLRAAPRGARTPPPASAPPTGRAATPDAAKRSSHTKSVSLRRRAGPRLKQARSG
jgi:peptidoglycan/LPS O-acetylase OafA/YrhL